MYCPFCQKIGYPADKAGGISFNTNVESWMCFHCPNVVKFVTPAKTYSICCLINDCWYEVTWLREHKKYIISQHVTKLSLDVNDAREHWSYNKKIVVQLDSEENITPSNIKDKLTTILVFT